MESTTVAVVDSTSSSLSSPSLLSRSSDGALKGRKGLKFNNAHGRNSVKARCWQIAGPVLPGKGLTQQGLKRDGRPASEQAGGGGPKGKRLGEFEAI